MKKLPECLEELARELPVTLTKAQAAQVMQISVRTFERAVDRGDIQVMKSNDGPTGRVSVTRSEVLRYMAARVVPSLVQPGQAGAR